MMKAKIGNIDIEGTPQEIKEFIINDSQETKAEANIIPNRVHSPLKDNGRLQDKILTRAEGTIDTSADNFHNQIKQDWDKDKTKDITW